MALGAAKSKHLAIISNKCHAMAWVDWTRAKVASVDTHYLSWELQYATTAALSGRSKMQKLFMPLPIRIPASQPIFHFNWFGIT
jgi:hypothetical protein